MGATSPSGGTEKEQSKSNKDHKFSERPLKPPSPNLCIWWRPPDLGVYVCMHMHILAGVGQEVLINQYCKKKVEVDSWK